MEAEMARLNGEIADQQKTVNDTNEKKAKIDAELKAPLAELEKLGKNADKELDKAGDSLQTMQQQIYHESTFGE
jgi:peptidoglycan hydrolase CwlO-like protein